MMSFHYPKNIRRSGIRLIILIVILSLAASCGVQPATPQTGGQHIPIEGGSTQASGGPATMTPASTDQPMTLGEGQASTQAPQVLPTSSSQPLTDEEVEAILSRLPTLVPDQAVASDFRIPNGPLPPPRTGQTVQQAFPPAATEHPVEQPAAEALEVLRFSPEGEIPVAPFISITFNQPMVPLATLNDLSKAEIPVKIEPDLPGIWRWVGTKTLTFNYASELIDRLPKSTMYKVIVPAGTKSQTGGMLAKAVEWTFTTPTAKLVSRYPEGISQPANPLIFLGFDQRVDPAAVLKTVTLTAGGISVSTRLSTDSDLKGNAAVARLVKSAQEGRWLVFQPVETLPLDTDISVTVGPNAPSAEGPLTSKETQSFGFRTYAPLKVVEHGCSWGGDTCRPLTPFFIRFNNPLDSTVFTEGMLKITPELPGVSANVSGTTITIQGETKGRTNYTITLDANIQDVYGQKLGKTGSLIFKVGPADKLLTGPNQTFISLDPASGDPALSVYSINYTKLDVNIYSVQPADWPAFLAYLKDYQRTDKHVSVPGKKVFDGSVDVKSIPDALTETPIKLKTYLTNNSGQFIVIVKPHLALFEKEQYWRNIQVWTQVTHLGLDVMTDHSRMTAWTTNLLDGKPVVGAVLSSNGTVLKTTSGETGLATFDIPNGATYLTAAKDGDTVMLPRSSNYWGEDAWNSYPVSDELRWYVFDDRQMYKPGEEVHLKGWLRRIGGTQTGDVGLVGQDVTSVSYQITEPQGNNIGSGQATVNALGGFDLAFTIPDKTNLGFAQINFSAAGSLTNLSKITFNHSFQIQEFRRPEFEVIARNDTPGPYFAGETGVAAVEAKYYAGGALPNADVTWQVTTSPASYNPPNWPEFTFGFWTPWWTLSAKSDFDFEGGPYRPGGKVETFTGKTDASGTQYLKIGFEKSDAGRPVSISAEATVMDVNRQAWTDTTSMLVHAADMYVGLHSERYFVEKGTPLKIEYIVTDLDGNPMEDRLVDMQAARLEWKYRDGRWSEEEVDVQKCGQASQLQPALCTFQTTVGGEYRITAVVMDDKGRRNKTELTRWVSGGKRPPARKVELEDVTLIPDRENYKPGDTAQILVQAPFSPAEGVLTVSRSGVLYTEAFQITGDTITLEVPIKEAYLPNLNVQVNLSGSAPRSDDNGEPLAGVPNRPAFAVGTLNLPIPPLQRELSLTAIAAQAETEPGSETQINVTLKDSAGQPVKDAEVAVVAVDEAILALTGYDLADPMALFYSGRNPGFTTGYTRTSIILADPLALAQTQTQNMAREMAKSEADTMAAGALPAAPMAMAPSPTMAAAAERGGGGAPAPAIRIRSDFNPLAVFAPSVKTSSEGKAVVPLKLPDNLTRYRVMAVAVSSDGKSFGSGESNLTARLPLMVRPSAPRFLNFGDQFELPVVLQNQTDADLPVNVAIRASNLEFTAYRGLKVTIPARNRVEVRFPARTLSAGEAVFQVAAVTTDANSYADASTISLPVYTPATTEAFATYGVIDQGAAFQPVAAPTDVYPQFGSLEISTSSTAVQSLTDAVLYLVAYPFECSEQLSSRILGVAALRDVLTAFKTKDLPSPETMEAAVERDITRLQGMQNNDGGFPYWRHGEESIPFNTIHAAHALQRARLKGYIVPAEMQIRVKTYLQQIENHYPAYYSERTRQTLTAYALYVRSLMGDKDAARAGKLIDLAGLENLSLDAVGWLWNVLVDDAAQTARLEALRRYVGNRVVETAGAANFTTAYDDQNYLLLGSNRRTDAILLDALMADDPQSDLIPKVVNGLLAHRVKGRWGNTQENVFVLLSLDRYFNTYEAQTPEFVANIWLGDQFAGSHTFSGRTTDYQVTNIPMKSLVDAIPAGEARDLVIGKEGAGRLYYRLGLSYAPTDLSLPPLDMGFVVQRAYEAVDNPNDVKKDADGVWHIKAGAKVKIHLTLVADNRRYHVALVDPLPAGLEAVNPALAVTGEQGETSGTQTPRYGWWWHWNWFEHQNLRDERAEVFTSLLWDGVYDYTYVARATSPGRFVVPPAKAEEMYSPEVFGRSANDVVIVE